MRHEAHLEDLRQLAEAGAFGEQQRRWALARHMVHIELEPDGADLRDGRTNVLQAKHKQTDARLTHMSSLQFSVCCFYSDFVRKKETFL